MLHIMGLLAVVRFVGPHRRQDVVVMGYAAVVGLCKRNDNDEPNVFANLSSRGEWLVQHDEVTPQSNFRHCLCLQRIRFSSSEMRVEKQECQHKQIP
mmetsp:Transcript_6184/g.12722  ORF Transcript_6184/g.12722 Transcript_6184/m.12722 type:complete len:97 (+) Transcript_6184:663-953(+)